MGNETVMLITNYIFGIIEDNSWIFVLPKLIPGLSGCTNFAGYPTGTCLDLLHNNQPFIFIPTWLLAQLLSAVAAYNLIIVGTVLLNFFFSVRFFRKLFGKYIAVLLSTIFIVCPYLAYQSRSHIDLIQFWPVIWFLDILLFSAEQNKSYYMALIGIFIIGTSNYLGYFTLLFMSSFVVWTLVVSKTRKELVKLHYRKAFKGLVVFLLGSLVFMAPYVKSNFLTPRTRMEKNSDSKAVNRPLEDFVTFSSRPWYYLLPSVDNPVFGRVAEKYIKILSSSGNYLMQNYFKSEHSAAYLGWINLIVALYGLKSAWTALRSRWWVIPLGLTIVTLAVFTLPPIITSLGVTLYTPSYILFKIFPMFRILSRMGVLILFLTLIFTGFGYQALLGRCRSSNFTGTYMKLALVVITLISISELYIPLKLTKLNPPPKIYTYLNQKDRLMSPIAVYPYNKTNEALFWMQLYKQPLLNPRGYVNQPSGFDSEEFTNQLTTSSGINKARLLGAKYLVYFHDGNISMPENIPKNSNELLKIDEFNESSDTEKTFSLLGLTLVRVTQLGNSHSNSAYLYKIR